MDGSAGICEQQLRVMQCQLIKYRYEKWHESPQNLCAIVGGVPEQQGEGIKSIMN